MYILLFRSPCNILFTLISQLELQDSGMNLNPPGLLLWSFVEFIASLVDQYNLQPREYIMFIKPSPLLFCLQTHQKSGSSVFLKFNICPFLRIWDELTHITSPTHVRKKSNLLNKLGSSAVFVHLLPEYLFWSKKKFDWLFKDSPMYEFSWTLSVVGWNFPKTQKTCKDGCLQISSIYKSGVFFSSSIVYVFDSALKNKNSSIPFVAFPLRQNAFTAFLLQGTQDR